MNKKLIQYIIIGLVIIVIVGSIVLLLGGYIKDSNTKRNCRLIDKVYVEGNKPGQATCIPK